MYAGQETWSWTGSQWLLRSAASPPGMRSGPAVAYDSNRGVVVLYGDMHPNRVQRDTWEWDGQQWSQNAAVQGPDITYQAHMTFDSRRNVMVLMAKPRYASTVETWEYDVASWRQVQAGGPNLLHSYAMTYDPRRGDIVLSGGTSVLPRAAQLETSTWLYTSTSLTPHAQELPTGSLLQWNLDLPRDGGMVFLCALASGADGIPVGQASGGETVVWPLTPDRLFRITFGLPSLLGVLDNRGRASPSLQLPADPGLAGLFFDTSAVTRGTSLRVRSVPPNVTTYIRH